MVRLKLTSTPFQAELLFTSFVPSIKEQPRRVIHPMKRLDFQGWLGIFFCYVKPKEQ